MRHTLAFLSPLLLALPAGAATFSVSTTLDLYLGGPTSFWAYEAGSPAFAPPFSVDLAEGDTFDFSIDFLGPQTLTVSNMSFAWAFSYANVSSDVVGTGQLQLLDTDGLVIYTSSMKTDQEGEVHFGQYFNVLDLAGLPATVTFGGLRYIGTVDDYIDPLVTTKSYGSPALVIQADSAVVAVPEPATGVMLLAGVAALAALRRRSRD
jgi:hypothetical protein